MIYEKDLDESIARYLGEPDPTIQTCMKLASCFTVKRELFGKSEQPDQIADADKMVYSYADAPVPVDTHITYTSDTEFSRAIDGRKQEDIWPIMDEMMSTVQALVPRLYDGVMRKLQE